MTVEDKAMVHGGYMLMMMDRCAAECSRRLLYDAVSQEQTITVKDVFSHKDVCYVDYIKANSALTVNVTDVIFFIGASLGDIIFLNAEVVKLGNKRIEIQVTGERENDKGDREKICTGKFVFCSMYNGESVPHGLTLTGVRE